MALAPIVVILLLSIPMGRIVEETAADGAQPTGTDVVRFEASDLQVGQMLAAQGSTSGCALPMVEITIRFAPGETGTKTVSTVRTPECAVVVTATDFRPASGGLPLPS